MQIDLTVISTIVASGGIIIGIIASLLSIQRFAESRKLGIYLEFNKLLYDTKFIQDMNEVQSWSWKTVEEFFAKYGPETNPEAFSKQLRVVSYFDGLCTLVRRKLIDYDFIPETTAILLIRFWDLFEPTADGLAKVYKRPYCWESIRHVYDRLHKIDFEYDREAYEKRIQETARKTGSPAATS